MTLPGVWEWEWGVGMGYGGGGSGGYGGGGYGGACMCAGGYGAYIQKNPMKEKMRGEKVRDTATTQEHPKTAQNNNSSTTTCTSRQYLQDTPT